MDESILPTILACFADTVVLTIVPCDSTFRPIKQQLDQHLQNELEILKQQAQEEEEYIPTRWHFENEQLFMRDKGAQGGAFPWVLECPKLTVCLGRGKRTGIIGQARLSSEYLWSCRRYSDTSSVALDLGKALDDVQVFLTSIYGQYILCKLSSIDLAVDFMGWDIGSLPWKERFVRRAQTAEEFPSVLPDDLLIGADRPFYRWDHLTGLSFGKHKSPLYCRLYDKTFEIRYQSPKKIWMHQHWLMKTDEHGQPLWDGKQHVYRLEISVRREVFRQLLLDGEPVIDGSLTVLDHIERLWHYLVGHPGGGDDGLPDGWLRYVIPTDDTNRSRWPVHPAWAVLQTAFAEPPTPESEEEREARECEALLQEVDDYLAAHPWTMQVKKLPSLLRKKKRKKEDDASFIVLEPPPDSDTRAFVRLCLRKENMDRALSTLAGWLSTIEAWRRTNGQEVVGDISDTLSFSYQEINNYLLQKNRDFETMVQKKRVLYRIASA